eukprot:COSAG02_NODE_39491_length_416_cov_1.104101_1_plen_27_part_01
MMAQSVPSEFNGTAEYRHRRGGKDKNS